MTDLRALTLIAPMGQAIVSSHSRAKRIENRPKSLPKGMLGQPTIVAVHCGLKWSDEYAETCHRIFGKPIDRDVAKEQRGHIIGLMRLSGYQFTTTKPPIVEYTVDNRGRTVPVEDPWFGGPFGYEIEDAIALSKPIKCRGGMGWWRVPLAATNQIIADLLDVLAPNSTWSFS